MTSGESLETMTVHSFSCQLAKLAMKHKSLVYTLLVGEHLHDLAHDA
jgi:hypothetical protein